MAIHSKEDMFLVEGPDGKMYLDGEEPDYGMWGRKRLHYLKTELVDEYWELIHRCDLNHHLNKIEREAIRMLDDLVKESAKRHGVTEELKNSDPMTWIGLMNNFRHEAEKVVEELVIY